MNDHIEKILKSMKRADLGKIGNGFCSDCKLQKCLITTVQDLISFIKRAYPDRGFFTDRIVVKERDGPTIPIFIYENGEWTSTSVPFVESFETYNINTRDVFQSITRIVANAVFSVKGIKIGQNVNYEYNNKNNLIENMRFDISEFYLLHEELFDIPLNTLRGMRGKLVITPDCNFWMEDDNGSMIEMSSQLRSTLGPCVFRMFCHFAYWKKILLEDAEEEKKEGFLDKNVTALNLLLLEG